MSFQDFSAGIYEPFGFAVARNALQGNSAIVISGYNPDISTGALESLWTQGGLYVFPAAASTMTVSSTSASDAAAGTGARTVLVQGLDASYLPISEVVTLNGQAAVSTVQAYLRINALLVISVGTGGANAGEVRIGTGAVVAGVPAVVYGHIMIGWNVDQAAAYTVPAGFTAYLIDLSGSASATTVNKASILSIRAREPGMVFYRGGSLIVAAGTFYLGAAAPRRFAPQTDIDVVVDTTDTNVASSIQLRLLLVAN